MSERIDALLLVTHLLAGIFGAGLALKLCGWLTWTWWIILPLAVGAAFLLILGLAGLLMWFGIGMIVR